MALNGVIDKPEDVNHFVFPAKKGQNFNIRVFARRLRSPLDSVISIAKKGGGAWPATTTRRTRPTATSSSPPPRTPNTSSRSSTTSRRAGPTTSTGSRSPRPSR